jgi:acetyltransferase-like isoleucine patch superfamily enzyme
MIFLSRLFSLFPLFIIILTLSSFGWLVYQPNPYAPLLILFTLYGLPLLTFRIHAAIFKSKEGLAYLIGDKYSTWWTGHQIQQIYIAFPALETLLRFVPGLFSLWLRLWGAKIGRSVYWTPGLEITDRDMLEVGDQVIFGHKVGLYAHVIKPKNDNLLLFTRRIRIGSGAFIGAGARLGPGVRIDAGALVPTASDHFPNSRVRG